MGLPPDRSAPISYIYATTYYSNEQEFKRFYGFFPESNNYLRRAQAQLPQLFGTPSSSNQGVSTKQTSSQVDNLTGVSKAKDVFNFSAQPGFSDQADTITSFSAKEKDSIQISKSVFGVATGRFAIAKNPKTLNKLLATDVDIVYNQKAGQLILNANGAEPGFGADGGVFALLAGNPKLATSSLTFV